jgi:hypothetical protein
MLRVICGVCLSLRGFSSLGKNQNPHAKACATT